MIDLTGEFIRSMVVPMIVQLTPEDERLVEECLRKGEFQTVTDVIHHALMALQASVTESHGIVGSSTPTPGVAVRSAAPEPRPRRNLVDVLCSSPFAGSELNFERQED